MICLTGRDLIRIEEYVGQGSKACITLGFTADNSYGLRIEVHIHKEGLMYQRTFTAHEVAHIIDRFYVVESVRRQAKHEFELARAAKLSKPKT